MEVYEVKKHWWFWVKPSLIALFCGLLSTIYPLLIIISILSLLIAFLRWKLDKIEIRDGVFYSRLGILDIDKKNIPLEQISFITEKTGIFSQCIGLSNIQINSSAYGKAIEYPCIANGEDVIKYVNEHK